MLLASGLPKFLWTEMIQHVTWIKNRTGTCALNSKIPYEMVFKLKPHLQDLPKWGSTIYILVMVNSKNGLTKPTGLDTMVILRATGSIGPGKGM